VPPYSKVFATRGYLAIFLTAALSTWGDFLALVTVASFVFGRTGSPLAAAATFAVGLLPSIFGRALLAPIADRIPYKYVLIADNLMRVVLVGFLIVAVSADGPLWALFALLFLIELMAGPANAASQILMTDLFSDRRLYARALGLAHLSWQVNQAIGIGIGGLVVASVGTSGALWFDLATFLVSALVLAMVVKTRPVRGTPSAGIVGFFRDIGEGAGYLFRQPVPVSLLVLSLCAVWAAAAPEAVAIAYVAAQDPPAAARLGGLLMAAPILGAVAGLIVVGRWRVERQNSRILVMALVMPLPLVMTVLAPPVPITMVLWFGCGMLQAFMLPLQSTFSILIPAEIRGRVFGLGGALGAASAGSAYLVAGYLAGLTSPATAVAICALGGLVASIVVSLRWPRAEMRAAVEQAYNS
jgi:MFS family permease